MCRGVWATPAPAVVPGEFAKLEQRLSDALASSDRSAVDRLWDDQLVFVFPDGKLSHKAERLRAQVPLIDASGPRLTASNDAVEIAYEDANVAVLGVHSSWRFGDSAPKPFVATHVWIRRAEGCWLLSAQVAEVKALKPTR